VAFSPDGKAVAVATWGNAIQLHDVASGKELPRGAGLQQPAFQVAMTPDGTTLATADGSSSVALWDAATGEPRRRLEGHEGRVTSARLSGDGRTLFSAGADDTVRAWDVASGRQLRQHTVRLGGTDHGVQILAGSPDGKWIVVCPMFNYGAPLRLLDATTGESARQIDPGSPVVHGASFLPDERSLVVWTGDGKARVWDVTTGKGTRQVAYTDAVKSSLIPTPIAVGGGPTISYFTAAVSPDGRLIAFGTPNDLIAVHNLISGVEVCRVEKLTQGVGCLAFSPDGRTLAWGSRADPKVHLLEVATGKERRAFAGHRGGVASLTFAADGRRLVSGGNDTTLLVWDLAGDRGAPGRAPSADDMDGLWQELLSGDAPRADRAVRKLAASPSAVGLLRDRIKPAAVPDEKRVASLIADLDSDDFAARQNAAAELGKLGDVAAAACRKALAGQPSAEARRQLTGLLEKQAEAARKPDAERVRVLRALEVLELAPTDEARRLLTELAKGAPGAWLTEEAKGGLARMKPRREGR
jgi:WD40 repeat protein